jgi:predicted integral membrane protein DUF2269
VSEVALFVHLLGVLLFVAGVALAGVAFETARRRERPAEIALLLGLARIGAVLVMSGGLLLLAGGLWLVGLEDDVDLGTGWVSAALTLFALALLLGGLGGQRPGQARLLASRLADEGEGTHAELRALLDDGVSRLANYASAALILAILALMVFKP